MRDDESIVVTSHNHGLVLGCAVVFRRSQFTIYRKERAGSHHAVSFCRGVEHNSQSVPFPNPLKRYIIGDCFSPIILQTSTDKQSLVLVHLSPLPPLLGVILTATPETLRTDTCGSLPVSLHIFVVFPQVLVSRFRVLAKWGDDGSSSDTGTAIFMKNKAGQGCQKANLRWNRACQ